MKIILFLATCLFSTQLFAHGAQNYDCKISQICDDSSLRYPMFCFTANTLSYSELDEDFKERDDVVIFLDDRIVKGTRLQREPRFQVSCNSGKQTDMDRRIKDTLR